VQTLAARYLKVKILSTYDRGLKGPREHFFVVPRGCCLSFGIGNRVSQLGRPLGQQLGALGAPAALLEEGNAQVMLGQGPILR